MTYTSDAQAIELSSVVLLENAPKTLGDALALLIGDAGAQLPADMPRLAINVGGAPMTFTLIKERLEADEFAYAVSQSLLRPRLEEAAATHTAYLLISAPAVDDVFSASDRLSNVTARFADEDNGLAVWIPESDFATTSVMYAGLVDRRPAEVWFNLMAAAIDESTALAHSIGLQHLGGHEVQLRTSALSPADAFQALRDGIASVLEDSALPSAGRSISIAGVLHTLVPATSMIGLGDVLDAVPVSSAPQVPPAAADEKPKRKGWFGRG